MIIRHWRSVLLVCTAAVLPVSQSFAQSASATMPQATADDTTVLQKIVVKGKRVAPGSVADTPLATEITKKQLEEKQVTNFDDIGRSVDAGVNYSRADAGFNLRGLSGARILTTIDGIPIPYISNSSRQGAFAPANANGGGDTFDFDSLSSLDIVRGADSSKGGSGMLGGAIVLNTLEPEDLIPEGRDWGAIVKSTYDSEDRSLSGSAAAAKKIGGTSILFQGGYRKGHERANLGNNDVYGARRTEANPADFDQNNLLFKLRQELEGGHRIGLTAERFRRDLETDLRHLQGGTSPRNFMMDNYDGREQRDRDRVSLDYDYEAQSSDAFFSSARATLYWQDLKKEAGSGGRTTADVAYGRNNEVENETWGFSGTATKDFEYSGLSHSVRVGLDVGVSSWSQYSWALCPTSTTCPSLNNQAEVPNVDSQNLGLVVEDKIEIGNTGFTLTPGFRFDWFNYDPSTGGGFANNTGLTRFGDLRERTEAAMSPKILATYDLTPDVELYMQLAVGFRAPTVDELYSRFYNPTGRYAQLGNPDLEPEIGRGIEIGTNFDTGDFTGRVAAFHTRYQNFIETVTSVDATGFTEFNYTNVAAATISGIEASAAKTFDNGINLHASLAYAYGRNEETTQRLRSVAPFKAIIGGGWSNETFGFDLSSTLSAGMLTDHLNTVGTTPDTTFDAPGYAIVDLTGWWTPEQLPGLRVQAGVYNIFDQEHYNALAVRDVNLNSATASQPREWYSEPGRTYKVSLTKTF
ncbi:TonB-dependent hemoglobin/transferrin/lactoferrin family receptor [Rhizobium bangladeshense]|uniref:TonB-dependent hemoglobin/transferrin/lactoferrin family receptor n=1 Tax=Rhizobium bangladeshense TaxID=1138189 RepID=A0ABS7LAZ3_9HYPH|nr:TonB-dependent hemoglobin/transferrin/lactoferrin family receptor [Rhizobium bangladeshense]MBX4866619.1 TonB-dependent hemoglobin/transferrin/lactoferrin family receptor [Rhizobium bangladeshense]MBX4873417.1 TonB-dependent hemoglobin/transferrin/lactoferrin family receptor [Rhizobium bangladeshense]MBX4883334.1 TonB-dependent hemoglobin/transferrin/lactoferrin family receptor [Rhizobium bangladeshense]MBX4894268.1 TonB-dependent hemoglobin/transferrin/lactoferrin family receptor [Rhizobium